MLLIKPQHGTVKLQLSTRSIVMSQGDEVEITQQEFQELQVLIRHLELVVLSDEEAEERRQAKAELAAAQVSKPVEEPIDDKLEDEVVDDVSDGYVSEYSDMPSESEVSDAVRMPTVDNSDLPEPSSCPYTRDGLMGLVKSEIWEIMDTLGITDKIGTKKVLIERIIDYYRG